MTNYRFVFSYDGTRDHGWESKKNADTVEGRIESVLTKMVYGDAHANAGRDSTDLPVDSTEPGVSANVDSTEL